MRTDDLDFALPEELIAQVPSVDRAESRLLHYRRDTREIEHRRFREIVDLLRPGDLLVFNDARVLPARFSLQKLTGGYVEGLLLQELSPGQWRVMLKNVGAPKPGMELAFLDAPEIRMQVISKDAEGTYTVAVTPVRPASEILEQIGRMPLPPYIHRQKHHDERDASDRERYQTVYAKAGQAVAAPTAGLHFTPAILDALDRRGVQKAYVTLNVGMGTFKPVSAETLEGHSMHVESYTITEAAAQLLNGAKREGHRVIAVGTTSARVLESQPAGEEIAPKTSETGIFIYPPYRWRHVSALITNFHLPRSTLIALVAGMVGLDEQRRLYSMAIEQRYRFFSYGDAMFIE
jgi:S-adenosylmethionine:tRNA ribosyltransferase-isomerase